MFSLFCYFFVLSICGIMDEVVTSGDILQFRLSALLCQTYTGYLFVFIICYFFFRLFFVISVLDTLVLTHSCQFVRYCIIYSYSSYIEQQNSRSKAFIATHTIQNKMLNGIYHYSYLHHTISVLSVYIVGYNEIY